MIAKRIGMKMEISSDVSITIIAREYVILVYPAMNDPTPKMTNFLLRAS